MALLARVRESFWFVPAVMCLLAAVAAQVLVAVDRSLPERFLQGTGSVLYVVGADGSRDVLGAIAGSMLAVASTTFSITIAVLALTSSSYGPRLVRNFMADRGNQLVLGVYVATYLYTLLVLRSIRTLESGDEEPFVPQLAVNGAVLLAVVSIGVLVWFIHHISDSIQVWTLASKVHGELRAVVDDLHPEQLGDEPQDAPVAAHLLEAARARTPARPVVAHRPGYVVHLDDAPLLACAVEQDVLGRESAVGHPGLVGGGDDAGHLRADPGRPARAERPVPGEQGVQRGARAPLVDDVALPVAPVGVEHAQDPPVVDRGRQPRGLEQSLGALVVLADDVHRDMPLEHLVLGAPEPTTPTLVEQVSYEVAAS